mmetsp:Transcript_61259/g.181182  ORF Transcript_61259/g.181182 Transcript_61259/m.181182 type:complete len:218 (-) Transcript_61259:117-770(-)
MSLADIIFARSLTDLILSFSISPTSALVLDVFDSSITVKRPGAPCFDWTVSSTGASRPSSTFPPSSPGVAPSAITVSSSLIPLSAFDNPSSSSTCPFPFSFASSSGDASSCSGISSIVAPFFPFFLTFFLFRRNNLCKSLAALFFFTISRTAFAVDLRFGRAFGFFCSAFALSGDETLAGSSSMLCGCRSTPEDIILAVRETTTPIDSTVTAATIAW